MRIIIFKETDVLMTQFSVFSLMYSITAEERAYRSMGYYLLVIYVLLNHYHDPNNSNYHLDSIVEKSISEILFDSP